MAGFNGFNFDDKETRSKMRYITIEKGDLDLDKVGDDGRQQGEDEQVVGVQGARRGLPRHLPRLGRAC